MVVKHKKTNRNSYSVGFLYRTGLSGNNTFELKQIDDGSKTIDLGKTFPGEVFLWESRNIVLSGVPSKFKIKVFLQSILILRLLVMKRLLTFGSCRIRLMFMVIP